MDEKLRQIWPIGLRGEVKRHAFQSLKVHLRCVLLGTRSWITSFRVVITKTTATPSIDDFIVFHPGRKSPFFIGPAIARPINLVLILTCVVDNVGPY